MRAMAQPISLPGGVFVCVCVCVCVCMRNPQLKIQTTTTIGFPKLIAPRLRQALSWPRVHQTSHIHTTIILSVPVSSN